MRSNKAKVNPFERLFSIRSPPESTSTAACCIASKLLTNISTHCRQLSRFDESDFHSGQTWSPETDLRRLFVPVQQRWCRQNLMALLQAEMPRSGDYVRELEPSRHHRLNSQPPARLQRVDRAPTQTDKGLKLRIKSAIADSLHPNYSMKYKYLTKPKKKPVVSLQPNPLNSSLQNFKLNLKTNPKLIFHSIFHRTNPLRLDCRESRVWFWNRNISLCDRSARRSKNRLRRFFIHLCEDQQDAQVLGVR